MCQLSEYVLSEINEEKTIANGKKLCSRYQPLVERHLKRILVTPMNSTSLVKFSNQIRTNNSFENKIIKRLELKEDNVGRFIKSIFDIKKVDKILGELLICKCFYGMTDAQISDKMKIAERTVRKYKQKAFYLLAIYNNKVSYIYEKTIEFYIN